MVREPHHDTSGPVTIQRVRAAWNSVRTKVESENPSLRGPLSRATLAAIDGNAVVLHMPNAVMADILRDHLALVESAIGDVLDTKLRVTLKVDGSSAPPRSKGGSAARTAASVAAVQPAAAIAEDPDELFSYLNERIK
jgi:hypothetical protein